MRDGLAKADGHPFDKEAVRCPKCGSADVRPSRRDGLKDALLSALARFPIRCRSCRQRFYVRESLVTIPENWRQ